MAHTVNGNLTGRAASTHRREIMQDIEAAEHKRIHDAWRRTEEEAIQYCIELEGADAFMAWYEDDNNVPPYGSIVQRIDLLKAHSAQLAAARYTKADKLVGDECANIITIADVAETMEKANASLR